MAVKLSFDRKAVEITWDATKVKGPRVRIVATNQADLSDYSIRTNVDNDGRAVLTYPADYIGSSLIVVEGAGQSRDEGTIDIS